MARLLVFGRRTYTDKETGFKILDRAVKNLDIELIIAGEASGADTIAKLWSKSRSFKYKGFPAQWHKYGNSAGPIRNQQMLDEGKPTHAVALFGEDYSESGGSWDMLQRCQKANIPVWIIKD